MGVAVYVMPLATWLSGDFRTVWAGGEATPPKLRRSGEEAEELREEFLERMESLLGRRPDWDDSGPARSATAFSAHAFSLPFLQARRWSYKVKLPQLSVLEAAQIWIPDAFESIFHMTSPWSDDEELMIASLPQVRTELDRLLEGLDVGEGWEEYREIAQAARALRGAAESAIGHNVPLIVEG
ncbi:MAG TPA: hypothetical protein VE981_23570 [Planctomycetota bacterium]|nr:hypothetical protein [Planctomycetota bacterium]